MTLETEPTTDETISQRCQACGSLIVGVNRTEYKRTQAGHILDKHSDQAADSLLEECRELLETNPDQKTR